jgi:hypothetical protein
MSEETRTSHDKLSRTSLPGTPKAPEKELELKLKKHPEDLDAKADVGSDESMDASDPSSATQPGGNEPAPSSTFPED